MKKRLDRRVLYGGMIVALLAVANVARADVLNIDFGDHENAGNPLQAGWDAFTITNNDTATAHSYGAVTVTVSDTGQPKLEDRLRAGPTGGSLTLSDMLRDFVFGDNNNPGEGLNVLIEGLVPNQLYQGRIWSHDDAAAVYNPSLTFIADWTANGVLIADDYNGGGSVPSTDDEKSFGFVVAADADGKILFQALRTPESDGSAGVINGLHLEPVPEPAAGALLLIGIVTGAACRRGRRERP